MKINGRSEAEAQAVMLDRHTGAAIYRKIAYVYALELQEEVSIDTPEGTMQASAGDYLVSDDPPTHMWPVKRDVFQRTYVRVVEAPEGEP